MDTASQLFNDTQFRSQTQYIPGHSVDTVATWVIRRFARLKAHRRIYDAQWPRYLDLALSRHWPSEVPVSDFWRSRLTVNYIWAIMQTIIATALDSDPKVSVSSSYPTQQEYASGLEACLDSIWLRGDVSQEMKDALLNACTFGTGFLIAYWDPAAMNGLGDIVVKEFPTEAVFPQEGARRISECDQMILRRLESRSFIEKYWPDKVHLCTPTSSSEQTDFERRRQTAGYTGSGGSAYLEGPMDGGYGYGGDDPTVIDKTEFRNGPYKSGGTEPLYEILEMYVKDDSLIEESHVVDIPQIMTDAMGNRFVQTHKQTFTTLKKRYETGWRHIFVCSGGRVTLEDGPSPYDCIPIVKVVDESIADEFWGRGEAALLESLQLELNKRRSQMIDHATLNGGAVWLVNKAARINQDELTNRPAQVIRYEYAGGGEIKREPGVPMPAFYLQMVEMTIRDMREVSGVSSAASSPPKGVRSGTGMEAAQNIATQRIRMRTKNVELAIRDLGRILIRMVQKFYNEPRWIRVVGYDGNMSFVPFNGKDLRGEWDLVVLPGSTMNMAQSAKETRAMELFKMKAIDQVALLQEINFHGRQEVVKRMGGVWPQQPPYQGSPGFPSRDSTDVTGYSLSVRNAGAAQTVPGMPPPGGTLPSQGQQVAPIGGNPNFQPGSGG